MSDDAGATEVRRRTRNERSLLVALRRWAQPVEPTDGERSPRAERRPERHDVAAR